MDALQIYSVVLATLLVSVGLQSVARSEQPVLTFFSILLYLPLFLRVWGVW